MTTADLVAASLFGALLLYVLLGGADFGAGVWDAFARGPRAKAQRRLIESAIAPVWEANHVWVILALVLLFTGFPKAFAALSIALHVPLTLMLVGIVLRGSAFVFRQYGGDTPMRERWGRAFAMASVVTPFFLGICIGAVASGNLPLAPARLEDYFFSWLALFPLSVGLLTLALFALLAALYLLVETRDPELRADFRKRAILAAGLVIAMEALAAVTLGETALAFRERFTAHLPSRLIQGLNSLAAMGTLLALFMKRFHLARALGILQAILVLSGWAYAQYPYLVGGLTIADTAAPDSTLRYLLAALTLGSVILFPSLYYLLRVFKGRRAFDAMDRKGGKAR